MLLKEANGEVLDLPVGPLIDNLQHSITNTCFFLKNVTQSANKIIFYFFNASQLDIICFASSSFVAGALEAWLEIQNFRLVIRRWRLMTFFLLFSDLFAFFHFHFLLMQYLRLVFAAFLHFQLFFWNFITILCPWRCLYCLFPSLFLLRFDQLHSEE